MTARGRLAPEAITFDFGNTLVLVDRARLRQVVEATADAVSERSGPFDRAGYLAAWDEERARQFREEVPRSREVDLGDRFVRVLARLRGAAPPPPDEPWDDARARTLSTPGEIDWAIARYADAFVALLPPDPAVGAVLAALAGRSPLAILSNWPHASAIDRYVEAAGWGRHFAAVVVSQRVGTIKPHPAIFAAARAVLGDPDPGAILHVGDDWAADVVGAKEAGWRTAWLRRRPDDTPLPTSERDARAVPDLEIDRLDELPAALAGTREPAAR